MAQKTPEQIQIEAMIASVLARPPAQKLDDSFYIPKTQDYYVFKDNKWKLAEGLGKESSSSENHDTNAPSSVRIITWNIDMLTSGAKIRMAAGLDHLGDLVSKSPSAQPIVIFLQEMVESDIQQVSEAPWIRERFFTTDIDIKNWGPDQTGTVTLVEKKIAIKQVFRVPWVSRFHRDGLFVDLALANSEKILRLCNTHLESLIANPPVRPLQLAAAAEYLHKDNVEAAILAGDLNAIEPFDRTIPGENKLLDAYLELGGAEDSEDGYTWGYQVPQWMREKFGCSRMDKVLYAGAIKPSNLTRIGVDVKVPEDKREELIQQGAGEWVTDHYGLMVDMTLSSALLGNASVI